MEINETLNVRFGIIKMKDDGKQQSKTWHIIFRKCAVRGFCSNIYT